MNWLARSWVRVLIAMAIALLLAWAASAGPITATITGCVTELPAAGAVWSTSDTRSGFSFFAAHDASAGCEPTIAMPTRGVYREVWVAGSYRVEALPEWMPTCGRVQFDAQGYASYGLDPSALVTLVFNTGIDCLREGQRTTYGGGPLTLPYSPPVRPEPPPVPTPTPVPEPSSGTLLLLSLIAWPVLHRLALWTTARGRLGE